MTVRIVVAEPSELIRNAVRALLPEGFVIAAEVGSAIEALRAVADYHPEMLVACYSLPKTDGLTFVRCILELHPAVKILLLSDGETDQLHVEAVRAGAGGIVSKDQPVEVIRAAIEQVSAGGKYLCGISATAIANHMRKPVAVINLSDRETDVLRMIANGLGTKEIATALQLTYHTVRDYRKTLMRKMGSSNVAELLATAAKARLLDQN